MQQVVAATLPNDYTIGWTGSAYQELATAGTGGISGSLFGLLMVFLILAAQYERWSLPLAVLTAVPFAVFGALLAVYLRGIENDVYFQIGLVTPDRPCRQERHSDRRVRPRNATSRDYRVYDAGHGSRARCASGRS